MNESSLPGVAITGTIGAGKTAVAEAVSGILQSREMRHALIDLDWLGQVYPPPDYRNPHALDLAFENLALIAPRFIASGARYFVLAATLTSPNELHRLRAALPHVDLDVCRVVASVEVIEERIRRRELGSLRDDFLSRTGPLASQMEASKLEDLLLVNDGLIGDAARELLRNVGWVKEE